MSSHLIYVPREHQVGLTIAEQLSAVGLADHAQGAATVGSDGPDESSGMLFGWNCAGRLHFDAKAQTWLPAVPKDDLPAKRYWIGVWNESPPGEKDLRRPYRYGGKPVQLGNGEQWLVPTPSELPHDAKLADDGSWVFVVQRRFHDYYLRAGEWVDKLAEPGGGSVTMLDMLLLSVEALSLNYRLTPELVSHLSLFDQVSAADCFASALGLKE